MEKRFLLPLFAALAIIACSETLPGGYTVRHADKGKAWLRNPDGTLAHGGLLKDLYRDDRRILLIALAEGGEAGGRMPMDGTCYIALLIYAPDQRVHQVSVPEAAKQTEKMSLVESYKRPCLRVS